MLIPVLVIILLLFITLIAFGVVKKRNAKKEIIFKALGSSLNLEFYKTKSFFEGTKFQLKGTYQESPIEVFETSKGSGKHKVRYTNLKLACPDFGFNFSIGKENFLTRIGKWIGFKDIEFQNSQLDRFFLFKSKDEGKFRALMNHDILAELSRVKSSLKGAIKYDTEGLIYAMPVELVDNLKKNDFENILPLMKKIADSKFH